MAAPTNTVVSTDLTNSREEWDDVTEVIAPEDYPFLSGVKKTKSYNILVNWSEETPPAASATPEAENYEWAPPATASPTVFTNAMQIKRRSFAISDTAAQVRQHQRIGDTQFEVERIKAELALAADEETIALSVNAKVSSGTRETAGFPLWVENYSHGTEPQSGSPLATDIDGTNLPTTGSSTALTRAMIETGLAACYADAGPSRAPSDLILPVGIATEVAWIGGVATNYYTQSSATPTNIIGGARGYTSILGNMVVHPCNNIAATLGFGVNFDYAEITYLGDRQRKYVEPRVNMDGEMGGLVSEFAVVVRSPKVHFGLFGITAPTAG